MRKRTSKTNREVLANGEFYHVYNRGTDRRIIFSDTYDVLRFFQSMEEFNSIAPIGSLYENSFVKDKLRRSTSKSEKLVNIVAYCLNPNHFHFILEQVSDGGVAEFMKRLSGGYTKYFNNKHKRSGTLFQGRYKTSHIDSNEYLLYVSAYVNLNDKVHQLGRSTSQLVKVGSFSSFDQYSNAKKFSIGINLYDKSVILGQFRNKIEYATFAKDTLKSILLNKELSREDKRLLIEI